MTLAVLLVGAILTACTVALCRAVQDGNTRLEAVQGALDTPHQAETRDFLLRGGEGVGFSERIALCNQLDAIIALPEADLAPLRFPYDHEADA